MLCCIRTRVLSTLHDQAPSAPKICIQLGVGCPLVRANFQPGCMHSLLICDSRCLHSGAEVYAYRGRCKHTAACFENGAMISLIVDKHSSPQLTVLPCSSFTPLIFSRDASHWHWWSWKQNLTQAMTQWLGAQSLNSTFKRRKKSTYLLLVW